MEKLQQALEKARRERDTVLLDRRSSPQAARAASVATLERGPREDEAAEAVDQPDQPRLVPVPFDQLRRNRLIALDAEDRRGEVFRMLRTRVLQQLEAGGKRTLAICSAGSGEGKTLIAANLAISLARHVKQNVLLAELDFRDPSLHKIFALPEGFGFADYLHGRGPLSDCLVNPGIPRLTLLPQYEPVQHSSELLAEPRMANLAIGWKRRYTDQIVICDLPPLLLADDPLICLEYADAVLLIIQEGKTKREDLERAVELIGNMDVLGVVLNDSRHGGSAYHDE